MGPDDTMYPYIDARTQFGLYSETFLNELNQTSKYQDTLVESDQVSPATAI